MVRFDTILRIATVVVSLSVVSAPILYPRYSLFTRHAEQAVATLREVRTQTDDIRLGYVEKNEKGFKQLSEVIELVFGFEGRAERICLAVGRPKDLGEFTGFGMEYGIGDNGVLYAETENGNPELLRWEPWSPTTTLELEKLQRGIQLRARERSHFITITLAVLWTTISIVLEV